MPVFKCTMILNHVSNFANPAATLSRIAGNSESYYTETDSESVARSRFSLLCIARARLLPGGARITGQRYQQVSPVGSASTAGVNYPGATANAADIAQAALSVRVQSASTINNGTLGLHYCPDNQLVLGEYTPTPLFAGDLSVFFTTLSSGQWKFKALDLTQEKLDLVGISSVGVGTTVQVNTINVDDTVKVYSTVEIVTDRKHSGTFKISAIAGATFTLSNWPHGQTVLGKIRKAITIYPTIGSVGTPKAAARKPGRPSSGYRGRRSARRR